jgi:signal transduction histidine kinase
VLRDLLRPWRDARTWRALAHDVTSLPLGIALFVPTVVLLAMTVGFLVIFPAAIVTLSLLIFGTGAAAAIERSRHAALLDAELRNPVPPLTARSPWGKFKERLRTKARWKEIAYDLVLLPLGALSFALTVGAWAGSLALMSLPFYVSHLPGGTAKFWLFEISTGPTAIGLALLGLVAFVFAAPWITVGMAALHGALGRALLGPTGDAELTARVSQLETSRTAAVDSAEDERRRIERDLHDGAQQRLVALAVDLGTARERMGNDPAGAQQLVAEAHEEAKAALKELRDLVRGIHPVILEDRGLDAALSAVVARSPVPVTLDVRVSERPPPVVESTAYFVVSEALANVARHAHAQHATVTIERAGNRLVVEVRDDGIGGADASGGTGLQGLLNRVFATGGSMHVVSPLGGPTTLIAEIPW